MSQPGNLERAVKRILRKYSVQLEEFIKLDLVKIAGHFHAKGLITDTAVSRMRVMGVDRIQLAAELMDACQPSLVQSPVENFPQFIAVLREFVTMEKIAGKMEEEFKEASQSSSCPVTTSPTAKASPGATATASSTSLHAGQKRKRSVGQDDEEVHKKVAGEHGKEEATRKRQETSDESSDDRKPSNPSASEIDQVFDSEPTTKDLRKLVARKVIKSEALGDMLGLEEVQVEMIKQRYSDPEQVNTKILTTWMEEQTKKPTTWRTLLKALQEMNMGRLAEKITEELKQRSRSH